MGEQKFISSSLLPYLSLSIVIGSFLRCSVGQKDECSSSCGLQTIAPPFHIKGDPDVCGDPGFELICMNDTTLIMELYNLRYHVMSISYENATIEVVGDDLAGGRCIVPSTFIIDPSADVYDIDIRIGKYQLRGDQLASFVNCSKEIIQKGMYQPVSCLSGNNTFVYFSYNGLVDSLLPSCRFLSLVPSSYLTTAGSTADIFQLLKKGFVLSWDTSRMRRSVIIKECLRRAPGDAQGSMESKDGWRRMKELKWLFYPFQIEYEFVYCIKNIYRDYSLYRLSVVLISFGDLAILLLGMATLGRFIIAPLSIYVFLSYELWKKFAPIDTVEKFLRDQQTAVPTRYAYTDIVAITRHFKEKIGQGGFGSVYKGELPGGYLVAVKMLGNSKCNGEDFINEVSTIGTIHHINIIRLVGFCSEGLNRALVYEFMWNGSLGKYIFSSDGINRKFTLEKLNEIALGVARGIDYLHRGCDMRILHFDIKPHNILLDQNFNPKVSDFGLAKLYPKDYSLVSACAARGTIGYMAPELVSRSFGLISYKSDVYSFGMLLLEMAGGRRNVDPRAENSSQAYYPSWIYDKLDQTEGVGFCNGIEIDNIERKLSKVGLWCIQMRPSLRPTMSQVIEMLEGDMDGVDMPPKPSLFPAAPTSRSQSAVDSSLSEISTIYENE